MNRRPPKLPKVGEVIPPPTLGDSPDFTAEEASSAEEVPNAQKMAERIGHLCCASCGERLSAEDHALRRFGGVHYSRVKMTCMSGHKETKVFKLWLDGST